MGKVDDEHDIPTADRRSNKVAMKLGFRGFDWWSQYTLKSFTLGLHWHVGEWWGTKGYTNGGWAGKDYYMSFLFWGCRLDMVEKWVPTDPTNPVPTRPTELEKLSRAHIRRETQEEVDARVKAYMDKCSNMG